MENQVFILFVVQEGELTASSRQLILWSYSLKSCKYTTYCKKTVSPPICNIQNRKLTEITYILIVLHGESFNRGHFFREGWSCKNIKKAVLLKRVTTASIGCIAQRISPAFKNKSYLLLSHISSLCLCWRDKRHRKEFSLHRHQRWTSSLRVALFRPVETAYSWSCNTSQQQISQHKLLIHHLLLLHKTASVTHHS